MTLIAKHSKVRPVCYLHSASQPRCPKESKNAALHGSAEVSRAAAETAPSHPLDHSPGAKRLTEGYACYLFIQAGSFSHFCMLSSTLFVDDMLK